MDLPDEFHTFCYWFHQDMHLFEDPVAYAIRGGLSSLSTEQKERLKKFFSDVLGGDLTDDELADIWAASTSDYYFNGPGVKQVMSEALKDL